MYKRLLALHNKLSTWSQSDGYSSKNYAKQFQPAFPLIPFYQRWPEIGLEITSRTTIYQVFWGLVS